MCVGYMQIVPHFIKGTWTSVSFGTHKGSWNQSLADTEGCLYIVLKASEKSQLAKIGKE